MLSIFVLFLFQTKPTPIAIEDLYATIIHSTVTIKENTFWISVEGRGAGRSNNLYCFDHTTRKAYKLDTSFTSLDVTCRLVPTDSGFAIIDNSGIVFTLDANGELQEQFSLSSLKNCPPSFRISEIQPIQDSEIALTYRDLDQAENLFLARVDLRQRTFEVDYVKHNEEGYNFWTWHNDEWYYINAKNGKISRLDNKFQVKEALVPELTPYLAVQDKKTAKLLQAEGYTPFLALVRTGSIVGDTTYFWRFHEQTKERLILHQLALRQGKFSVINNERLILAKFAGGVLEFDRGEQSFTLRNN